MVLIGINAYHVPLDTLDISMEAIFAFAMMDITKMMSTAILVPNVILLVKHVFFLAKDQTVDLAL